MADNVVINTGTAATVAAEDVGGTEYQRIKIVDGGAAGTLGVVATSAAPAAGTVGLVVRVAGTVGIAPTAMTVNTSPTTLTVNTAPTVSGASVTIQQGVSVSLGNLATVDATAGTSAANASIGVVVALKLGAVVSVGNIPLQVTGFAGGAITVTGSALSVSTIGSVGVVNSVSTIGSVGVVNSISTVGGTVLVSLATAGSVTALDVARTQFVLVVSSTSPSNAGMLLFTAYLGSAQAPNTAGVSLFAIPAGKNLRILNIQAVAAGSASALVGQVQVVFATSAASVTVSAIGGRGPAVAMAGSTTVFSQFAADGPQGDIPATQTVGVGVTVNTSCLLGGVIVHGYLFP